VGQGRKTWTYLDLEEEVRVFVAGATGVLGRRLVREFCARGDSVVGLVRSPAGEQLVASLGGESRRADLFDAEALARAAEGCEVIVHAATSIPVKTRPGPKDWQMNDRIRREGTRALAACAAKVGAKLYLQQSVIWIARPADGSPFDEDAPAEPDPVSRSAFDGEEIAGEAGGKHGFDVSVLRCGWFYGADAAHTRFFADGLRARRLPVIGKGDAVRAILHLDDAADAFVAASAAPRSGLWHVVDDRPVSVREFMDYFAERLAAPPAEAGSGLAGASGGGVVCRRFLHHIFTDLERAVPPRFRMGAALPDLQGGDRSDRGELEGGRVRAAGRQRRMMTARDVALAVTATVVAHAGVVLLHAWAHVRLAVNLSWPQNAFIGVVIMAGPLVAGALVWTRHRWAGALTLAVSMFMALVFGAYHHYFSAGMDNVSRAPAGDWGGVFRVTAALLVIVEAWGSAVGWWGFRRASPASARAGESTDR
jgi:nucleoside-diphosphate-sugar epimerase